MKENKKMFIDWVKAHRRQLLIAGISATAVIGIAIGLKNKDSIKGLWEALENSISKTPEKLPESITILHTVSPVVEEIAPVRLYTSPQKPFDVSQHIRNLSGGRHHSAEKAAEAVALGIDLAPHQTLVDTYKKYAA